MPGRGAIALVLVVLAGACERADRPPEEAFEPLVAFDTVAVRIETAADTVHLTAELAETEDQRAYGLMERPRLPEDHGMLFVYTEPQDSASGFWMYRTRVPLDIAFLDEDGRIVAIRSMEPCESPNPRLCRIYSPGVPYSAALEVNRGYFERHGITMGDRVVRVERKEPAVGEGAGPGRAASLSPARALQHRLLLLAQRPRRCGDAEGTMSSGAGSRSGWGAGSTRSGLV